MSSQPLRPREHQAAACAAATEVLEQGGSAMVVMATGTGKTLVGSLVASRVAAGRVLVLVPTLALVRQTIEAWQRSAWWSGHQAQLVAVCSDNELGHALGVVDEVAVTTDASELADLAAVGDCLVVGTYQSSAVLADAAAELGLPLWDLVVCDEAHHLAGAASRRSSYSAVVRGAIPATRRLYLTATPRRWRAGGRDTTDVGELARGPIVYDLRLGAAVAAGLAADYQVVVAAADAAVLEEVRGRLEAELEGVDARTVAVAVAVACAMRRRQIRRMVSFHNRVGRAHQFASALKAVCEVLDEEHRPQGQGTCAWVSAGSSVGDRAAALGALGDDDRGRWAVVANARLLGEGVDLPDLDAVAIVDPRSSTVDVTQAVGRALRARPGKQAVVLVPVVVEAGGAGAAIDEAGLAAACSVLRALRAHDERLGEKLDGAARALHRGQDYRRIHRQRLASHLQLDVDATLSGRIAETVMVAAVRSAAESWEEAYGLLERWVDTHGHADVPQSEEVALAVPTGDGRESFGLGTWVSRQRMLGNQGQLSAQRHAALEVLDGWTWDAVRSRVDERIEALVGWLEANPSRSTPPAGSEVAGINVAQVCNWARGEFAGGTLDQAQAARLEAQPNWVWNQRTADWWDHHSDLVAWVERHGHAQPSSGDTTQDGFDLGRWVTKQRGRLRAGTLDEDRAAALRGLAGWVDDVLAARWQAQYEALVAWIDEHGHACPPQTATVEVGGEQVAVGRFVAKQRARRRRGCLVDDGRAAALEQLPGWDWEPGRQRATWEQSLAVLRRWADEHGHARVAFDEEVDGLALGTWVTAQRTARREGRLSRAREQRLDAIDGWSWDPLSQRWWRRLEQVAAWVARNGPVEAVEDVGTGQRDGGWQLGAWWYRQFARLEAERLEPDQAAALQALLSVPGSAARDEEAAA